VTEDDRTSDGQYQDAMATGSDAGAPGEHLPEPPLRDDERALLAELRQTGPGDPITAVEDSPEMVRAAEDDSPLATDLAPGPDEDTPRFEPPAI
jgi:hypothetical protein